MRSKNDTLKECFPPVNSAPTKGPVGGKIRQQLICFLHYSPTALVHVTGHLSQEIFVTHSQLTKLGRNTCFFACRPPHPPFLPLQSDCSQEVDVQSGIHPSSPAIFSSLHIHFLCSTPPPPPIHFLLLSSQACLLLSFSFHLFFSVFLSYFIWSSCLSPSFHFHCVLPNWWFDLNLQPLQLLRRQYCSSLFATNILFLTWF